MKLQKTSVFLMVILAVVTLGLYIPYWFLEKKNVFNSLSKNKLSHELAYFVFVIYFIHIMWAITNIFSPLNTFIYLFFSSVIGFFASVAGLISIVLGFEVRKILLVHFGNKKKISKIWTFLFSPYYLQYKINKGIK